MPGPNDRPASRIAPAKPRLPHRLRRLIPTAPRLSAQAPPRLAVRVVAISSCVAAVSIVAGFAELASFAIQVDLLHLVDLNSLRISRHAMWMIPVAGALSTLGIALALLGPLGIWAILRRTIRGRPLPWWWRSYAGTVLGAMVFLAPLLAVRGLHAMAAVVLATGLGIRLRSFMIGSSPRWNKLAIAAGGVAMIVMPGFALAHYRDVAAAPARAAGLPPRQAPNVLWIVMDTTRADRLSLYGYDRETSPSLSRWAKQGIVFDEARSAAPWTLPSHVSMFTSLWPYEGQARIDHPYTGTMPTIAEHLGSLGYATAGFAANTGMCNACFGVGRGFDLYVEMVCNHEVSLKATMLNSAIGRHALKSLRKVGVPVPTQFPFPGRSLAPTIAQRGKSWLDEIHAPMAESSPRPFFLFLNFMDDHGPYVPLAENDRKFSGDRPMPPKKKAVPTTGTDAYRAFKRASDADRPALRQALDETTRLLSDLYDDCIRGLDRELGDLLDGLHRSGKLDNTWVVVTADHGEYFGEHGLFGHGGRLHNEVTRVPLMLIPPMGADHPSRGTRVTAPVSLCNLPATLGDLLVPGEPHPFRGMSLARYWQDASTPAMPILMQMEEQAIEGEDVAAEGIVKTDALVHENHVLLRSSDRAPELFRLDDRTQARDLAGHPEEQERLTRMQATLDSLLGGSSPR